MEFQWQADLSSSSGLCGLRYLHFTIWLNGHFQGWAMGMGIRILALRQDTPSSLLEPLLAATHPRSLACG